MSLSDPDLLLQRAQHGLDIVGIVDRAQARHHVQVVLREGHAVVLETRQAMFVLVASEHAVFLGYAHHALHRGKRLDLVLVERVRVAEQVDLGETLLLSLHHVRAHLHARQRAQEFAGLAVIVAGFVDIGVEYQQHVSRPVIARR